MRAATSCSSISLEKASPCERPLSMCALPSSAARQSSAAKFREQSAQVDQSSSGLGGGSCSCVRDGELIAMSFRSCSWPFLAQIYRSQSRNLPAGIGGQADDSQVIAIDQMLHIVPRAEPGQQPLVERRRDLGPKCSAPAVEPGDPRSTWAIRSRSSFISLVRRGRAADRCAKHRGLGASRGFCTHGSDSKNLAVPAYEAPYKNMREIGL